MTTALPPPHPGRQPGRHGGRVLRFLHLRDRRGAGVRAAVLPGRRAASAQLLLSLCDASASPSSRGRSGRWCSAISATGSGASRRWSPSLMLMGGSTIADRLPADLCAGRLDRAAAAVPAAASGRASGWAANGAGRRCSRSRMRRRAGARATACSRSSARRSASSPPTGCSCCSALVLTADAVSRLGLAAAVPARARCWSALGLWVRLKLTETPAFARRRERGAAAERAARRAVARPSGAPTLARHVRGGRVLRALLYRDRLRARLRDEDARLCARGVPGGRSWARSCSWRSAIVRAACWRTGSRRGAVLAIGLRRLTMAAGLADGADAGRGIAVRWCSLWLARGAVRDGVRLWAARRLAAEPVSGAGALHRRVDGVQHRRRARRRADADRRAGAGAARAVAGRRVSDGGAGC